MIKLFGFVAVTLLSLYSHGEVKMSPQLGSLFLMCNDVSAIKAFYGDALKLKTIGSPEEGYLDVDIGIHLTYFKGDYELPVQKDWAWQPGYQGGSANVMSWTIKFSEADFRNIVTSLKTQKVEHLKELPEWRLNSYWGLTVKDPMGYTVELYTVPDKKPEPPFNWK